MSQSRGWDTTPLNWALGSIETDTWSWWWMVESWLEWLVPGRPCGAAGFGSLPYLWKDSQVIVKECLRLLQPVSSLLKNPPVTIITSYRARLKKTQQPLCLQRKGWTSDQIQGSVQRTFALSSGGDLTPWLKLSGHFKQNCYPPSTWWFFFSNF